jgi:hypothetical protein
MRPDDTLVPLIGPLAHIVAHAIGELPGQVLPYGYGARVVGESPCRVAHRFGGLALDYFVLPVVDILPLGTIWGLDSVHPLKESVLALRDPVSRRGHQPSPFVRSCGLTLSALASLLTVPEYAPLLSASSAAIVARPTSESVASSSCVSPRR